MRTERVADPRVCSINEAMEILGTKWVLLIVRELQRGAGRFDALVHNTGAPRDVLAVRLREMEAAGLVEKRPYLERPMRYEYLLTEAGEGLYGVTHAIRAWGDRYARDDPDYVAEFVHECGARLEPVVICEACGQPLVQGDAHAVRDFHRSDKAERLALADS